MEMSEQPPRAFSWIQWLWIIFCRMGIGGVYFIYGKKSETEIYWPEGQITADTDHVFSKRISFFLLGVKLNLIFQPLLQLGGGTWLTSGQWYVDQVDVCFLQA